MARLTVERRKRAEEELDLAKGYVHTREEYEARGVKYLGSFAQAAQAGYLTPRGCKWIHQPVCDEEWEHIKFCAAFVNCYPFQRIGGKPPCLPVFARLPAQQPRAPMALTTGWLSVDLGKELKEKVALEAKKQGLTIQRFVILTLEKSLMKNEAPEEPRKK